MKPLLLERGKTYSTFCNIRKIVGKTEVPWFCVFFFCIVQTCISFCLTTGIQTNWANQPNPFGVMCCIGQDPLGISRVRYFRFLAEIKMYNNRNIMKHFLDLNCLACKCYLVWVAIFIAYQLRRLAGERCHTCLLFFWYPQGTLNGYELKAMRGVALWNTMDQSCERCSPYRLPRVLSLLVCNNAITLNYILPQTLLAWLDTCLGLCFTSVNSPCPPVFVVFSHRFCVVGLNSDAAFRSLYARWEERS